MAMQKMKRGTQIIENALENYWSWSLVEKRLKCLRLKSNFPNEIRLIMLRFIIYTRISIHFTFGGQLGPIFKPFISILNKSRLYRR